MAKNKQGSTPKTFLTRLIFTFQRVITKYQSIRLAKHFTRYLQPIIASTPNELLESFKIRHQVYCEELGYEPSRHDRLETDEFDAYSYFCLVQHKSSGFYTGTTRMVAPEGEGELLPIEKYCAESLATASRKPSDFPRQSVCEISRLAVPEQFRRRNTDQFKGAGTGSINEVIYSEEELRCFPLLAVSLYLAATSITKHTGRQHMFVMMEPRLARSLAMVGIHFEQLGPTIEYHGKRAPYYVTPDKIIMGLPAGNLYLFSIIHKSFAKQMEAAQQESGKKGVALPEPV